jgi:hypothetical protein
MPPACWAARRGPWKLEIRNWKLETGQGLQFPVSSFEFRVSKVREDGRKKKNYERSHQVVENKGSKNKIT